MRGAGGHGGGWRAAALVSLLGGCSSEAPESVPSCTGMGHVVRDVAATASTLEDTAAGLRQSVAAGCSRIAGAAGAVAPPDDDDLAAACSAARLAIFTELAAGGELDITTGQALCRVDENARSSCRGGCWYAEAICVELCDARAWFGASCARREVSVRSGGALAEALETGLPPILGATDWVGPFVAGSAALADAMSPLAERAAFDASCVWAHGEELTLGMSRIADGAVSTKVALDAARMALQATGIAY